MKHSLLPTCLLLLCVALAVVGALSAVPSAGDERVNGASIESAETPLPANSEALGRARFTSLQSPLSFLAVGDWGCLPQSRKNGNPNSNQMAVANAMKAVKNPPTFVISLGDNFYEDGVKSEKDWRFAQVFEDVYKGLDVPWYVVVGNHDWRAGDDGIQAQVRYSQLSKKWQMPSTYYDKVVEVDAETKLHLVFLDTTKIIDGDHKQVRWLADKLESSRAQFLFVIGHHPVISDSDHGNIPQMLEHVYPLLNQHEVDAYIAGHDHVLEYLKDGDVHYLVIGSGCKLGHMKTSSPHLMYGEATLGFLNVQVTSKEAQMQIVKDDGSRGYEVVIPRRRK